MTWPELRREMEARIAAATKGPWVVRICDGRRNGVIESANEVDTEDGKSIATVWDRGKKENRYFIAHARTDLPAALARVTDLESELSAVKADRDEFRRRLAIASRQAKGF